MRRLFVCVATLLLLLPLVAAAQRQPGPSAVDITFDVNRWPWPLYEEVASRLQTLAKQHPTLVRTYSIGKTGEGRDLWVIEMTNAKTGPAESKPAMWMDGNIHANEVWGRQGLLYTAEKWLANHGKDASITQLLDTRAFYILPMFDADGGGARNYQVRPLMSHPFDDMPTEDNDFYTRVGAIWSLVSHGGVMNNNYYGTEVKAGRDQRTATVAAAGTP